MPVRIQNAGNLAHLGRDERHLLLRHIRGVDANVQYPVRRELGLDAHRDEIAILKKRPVCV
jgi:hypothetical protein